MISESYKSLKKSPLDHPIPTKECFSIKGWFWADFRKVATQPIVKSGASYEAQLPF
jgi:hypothetical protein